MANFEVKDGKLFIDGHEVIKGWESFSGWFWFATEKVADDIWFGFVQGFEEEWGNFSQSEIEALAPKTWELKKESLAWARRRTD